MLARQPHLYSHPAVGFRLCWKGLVNGSSAGTSVSGGVIINGMGTIPIQAGQPEVSSCAVGSSSSLWVCVKLRKSPFDPRPSMLDSPQWNRRFGAYPVALSKIRTSRRRTRDGTHHGETASGLRTGKDDSAQAHSKLGPGSNGGDGHRRGGSRGRKQSG